MSLTTDITNLTARADALITTYENKRDEINTTIAAKSKEVDDFIKNATPETRYVQDIHIKGSKDFFYPLWWRFPNNSAGCSRLTIARQYPWNGGVAERPLNASSPAQAALLLELEGNSYPWHGDANFMEIKRFVERYNNTVSHLSFSMYCKAEKIDPSLLIYGSPDFGKNCSVYSGVYLRGGGLTYRIIKNWKGDIKYHDGVDQGRRVLSEQFSASWTVRWYAEPIPFSDRLAPTAVTAAFGRTV